MKLEVDTLRDVTQTQKDKTLIVLWLVDFVFECWGMVFEKFLELGKLVKSMPGYLYDMVEQLGYSDVEEEWRYLNWIYG